MHRVPRSPESDHDSPSEERVWVGVRVRPPISSEQKVSKQISWKWDDHHIYSSDINWDNMTRDELANFPDDRRMDIEFDRVFNPFEGNEVVYREQCLELVQRVVEGFNSTIIAYGQTTSGKTHTILGNEDEKGLMHLALADIFNFMRPQGFGRSHLFRTRISYCEIYQETIQDLMDPKNRHLNIYEDPIWGPSVKGISEYLVNSAEEAIELLKAGQQNRQIGKTGMSDSSSRSHTIFQIRVESKPRLIDASLGTTLFSESDENLRDNDNFTKTDTSLAANANDVIQEWENDVFKQMAGSSLNIIDLAGSERVSKTKAKGKRLKEAGTINRSLSTLGNVIAAINNGDKHKPFRDSKLTRLLKSALGGNSFTAMICCISPVLLHHDESRSTLQFARRASAVVTRAKLNQIESGGAILQKFKEQVVNLQRQLVMNLNEKEDLQEKVHKLEEKLTVSIAHVFKTPKFIRKPKVNFIPQTVPSKLLLENHDFTPHKTVPKPAIESAELFQEKSKLCSVRKQLVAVHKKLENFVLLNKSLVDNNFKHDLSRVLISKKLLIDNALHLFKHQVSKVQEQQGIDKSKLEEEISRLAESCTKKAKQLDNAEISLKMLQEQLTSQGIDNNKLDEEISRLSDVCTKKAKQLDYTEISLNMLQEQLTSQGIDKNNLEREVLRLLDICTEKEENLKGEIKQLQEQIERRDKMRIAQDDENESLKNLTRSLQVHESQSLERLKKLEESTCDANSVYKKQLEFMRTELEDVENKLNETQERLTMSHEEVEVKQLSLLSVKEELHVCTTQMNSTQIQVVAMTKTCTELSDTLKSKELELVQSQEQVNIVLGVNEDMRKQLASFGQLQHCKNECIRFQEQVAKDSEILVEERRKLAAGVLLFEKEKDAWLHVHQNVLDSSHQQREFAISKLKHLEIQLDETNVLLADVSHERDDFKAALVKQQQDHEMEITCRKHTDRRDFEMQTLIGNLTKRNDDYIVECHQLRKQLDQASVSSRDAGNKHRSLANRYTQQGIVLKRLEIRIAELEEMLEKSELGKTTLQESYLGQIELLETQMKDGFETGISRLEEIEISHQSVLEQKEESIQDMEVALRSTTCTMDVLRSQLHDTKKELEYLKQKNDRLLLKHPSKAPTTTPSDRRVKSPIAPVVSWIQDLKQLQDTEFENILVRLKKKTTQLENLEYSFARSLNILCNLKKHAESMERTLATHQIKESQIQSRAHFEIQLMRETHQNEAEEWKSRNKSLQKEMDAREQNGITLIQNLKLQNEIEASSLTQMEDKLNSAISEKDIRIHHLEQSNQQLLDNSTKIDSSILSLVRQVLRIEYFEELNQCLSSLDIENVVTVLGVFICDRLKCLSKLLAPTSPVKISIIEEEETRSYATPMSAFKSTGIRFKSASNIEILDFASPSSSTSTPAFKLLEETNLAARKQIELLRGENLKLLESLKSKDREIKLAIGLFQETEMDFKTLLDVVDKYNLNSEKYAEKLAFVKGKMQHLLEIRRLKKSRNHKPSN